VKIGVVVRLGDVPTASGEIGYPSFSEIRSTVRRIEDAGFDSLWVFDHLLYRDEPEHTVGIWEGWTMLSAIAAVTERVELGPLVMCTLFRNPALLAKMAATLDEVSNGRLVLGLGAGWNSPEFDAFDFPFDHRVQRFTEALQIIVPLLRDGHVDFQGEYYSARNAEILPRGPRPAGPPILIGGWGPKMLALVTQYADVWNGGYCGPIDTFRPILDGFHAAQANAGTDGSRIEATALLKIGWDDLADIPDFFEGEYVTGSAAEMAHAFAQFAGAGVGHLMCQYHPNTTEALERLVGALHHYRAR
jgi:alkanesulfonate monooxygenase SsuD/methylene tetrahydromethanopterin reductase-like flavin-dependent oxidoreductase (luciferase family)